MQNKISKPQSSRTLVRKSSRPRPDGRLTFMARHMGINLATFYKYRKGLWPQPYDYDERLSAAEAAWEQHLDGSKA